MAKFLAELRCWGIGEAEERGVGNPVKLGACGAVESRMIVTMEVGPNRGVAVEVDVAVLIVEGAALPANDAKGLALEPVSHVGEGVPCELAIPVGWIVLNHA